jgi:uncharacterized protein with PIN domain
MSGIVPTNRIGEEARAILIHFLHEWKVEIIPFGDAYRQRAVIAYARFGKASTKRP